MKRLKIFLVILLLLGFGISGASALPNPDYSLFDYGFNIDGNISFPVGGDPVPAEADVSTFDDMTGLGSISIAISGIGTHYVGLFVDHEIDQSTNTYFNEYGSATGSPAAGQSWEIDDPFFGGIFFNFADSALQNTNSVPSAPNDVSMAMGWNFVLDPLDPFATISFLISTTEPTNGFYLTHTDPDSDASIYFSSTYSAAPVPEPATLLLLSAGLGSIGVYRKLRKRG